MELNREMIETYKQHLVNKDKVDKYLDFEDFGMACYRRIVEMNRIMNHHLNCSTNTLGVGIKPFHAIRISKGVMYFTRCKPNFYFGRVEGYTQEPIASFEINDSGFEEILLKIYKEGVSKTKFMELFEVIDDKFHVWYNRLQDYYSQANEEFYEELDGLGYKEEIDE